MSHNLTPASRQSDYALECEIEAARKAMEEAIGPIERLRLWLELKRLIGSRSHQQVENMERVRNLR